MKEREVPAQSLSSMSWKCSAVPGATPRNQRGVCTASSIDNTLQFRLQGKKNIKKIKFLKTHFINQRQIQDLDVCQDWSRK